MINYSDIDIENIINTSKKIYSEFSIIFIDNICLGNDNNNLYFYLLILKESLFILNNSNLSNEEKNIIIDITNNYNENNA